MYRDRLMPFLGLVMLGAFLYFARFELIYLAYPHLLERGNADLIYNPGSWACDYTRRLLSENSPAADRDLIYAEALTTLRMTDQDIEQKIVLQKPTREMARLRMDPHANSMPDQVKSVRDCVRDSLLLNPEKAAETLTAILDIFPTVKVDQSTENKDWLPLLNRVCHSNSVCKPPLQQKLLSNVEPNEYSFYFDLLKTAHGNGLAPILEVYSKIKDVHFDIAKNNDSQKAQIVSVKSLVRATVARNETNITDELVSFVNDSALSVPLRYHIYTEIPDLDKERATTFIRNLAAAADAPQDLQAEAHRALSRGARAVVVTFSEFNQIQSNLISALTANKISAKDDFRSNMEKLLTSTFESSKTPSVDLEKAKAGELFEKLFVLANEKFGASSNEIQQLLIIARNFSSTIRFENLAKPLFNRRDSFVLAYQLVHRSEISAETKKQMLQMFRQLTGDEKKAFLATCSINRTQGRHFSDLIPELEASLVIKIRDYWDGNPTQALEQLQKSAAQAVDSTEQNLKIWAAAYIIAHDSAAEKKLTSALLGGSTCNATQKTMGYWLWSSGQMQLNLSKLKTLLDCLDLDDIVRLRYSVTQTDDINKLNSLVLSKQTSPDQLLKIRKILSFSNP